LPLLQRFWHTRYTRTAKSDFKVTYSRVTRTPSAACHAPHNPGISVVEVARQCRRAPLSPPLATALWHRHPSANRHPAKQHPAPLLSCSTVRWVCSCAFESAAGALQRRLQPNFVVVQGAGVCVVGGGVAWRHNALARGAAREGRQVACRRLGRLRAAVIGWPAALPTQWQAHKTLRRRG
jgi:hypothetical protein